MNCWNIEHVAELISSQEDNQKSNRNKNIKKLLAVLLLLLTHAHEHVLLLCFAVVCVMLLQCFDCTLIFMNKVMIHYGTVIRF